MALASSPAVASRGFPISFQIAADQSVVFNISAGLPALSCGLHATTVNVPFAPISNGRFGFTLHRNAAGGKQTIRLKARFSSSQVTGTIMETFSRARSTCNATLGFTVQVRDRVVTQKMSGKRVSIPAGGVLAINLRESPGTGFSWTVSKPPQSPVLRFLSDRFKPGPCPAGAGGCSGTEQFRYRAVAPGTTTLEISLIPPGGTTPTEVFKLTVVVT